jgi:hypothetical protein
MRFLLKCFITSKALEQISALARLNENYLSELSLNWQNFISSSHVYFIIPEAESITNNSFEINYLKRLNRLFYYPNIDVTKVNYENYGRHIILLDPEYPIPKNLDTVSDTLVYSNSIPAISTTIKALLIKDSYSKKMYHPVFKHNFNLPINTLIYHDQYFIDQTKSDKTKKEIELLINDLIKLNRNKINKSLLNIFFIDQWSKLIKYDLEIIFNQIEKEIKAKYQLNIKFHYLKSNPHHRIFLSDYFFAISPNTMTKNINIKLASAIGDAKEFIENLSNVKETAKGIKHQLLHDTLIKISPFNHPIEIKL